MHSSWVTIWINNQRVEITAWIGIRDWVVKSISEIWKTDVVNEIRIQLTNSRNIKFINPF